MKDKVHGKESKIAVEAKRGKQKEKKKKNKKGNFLSKKNCDTVICDRNKEKKDINPTLFLLNIL